MAGFRFRFVCRTEVMPCVSHLMDGMQILTKSCGCGLLWVSAPHTLRMQVWLAAQQPGVAGVVLHSPLLSGVRVFNPTLRYW